MQVSLLGAMINFINEVEESQEELSPAGLIVKDMVNLMNYGNQCRCEMLIKDESTLNHMKTIKYALEGTLSAKVVNDTIKLLNNPSCTDLEVLQHSEKLKEAFEEEQKKMKGL